MATITGLITVAEFAGIPDPPSGRYELRNGELILVPPAPKRHYDAQIAMSLALHRLIGSRGLVGTELPFRPTAEHNVWMADVASVTSERWNHVGAHEWLPGAPELVLEIISPSNTVKEMNERERICLENGCIQFWTVDLDLRIVKVSTGDGKTITHREDSTIDLDVFGGDRVAMGELFA